ncbi:MAG: cation-transporting P-type ATPase [Acidobacteriia bacterium]|nr:cation-transporting P-type ATPase [Terriglobia bacterium]
MNSASSDHAWHALSALDVWTRLGTSASSGLRDDDARQRQRQFGLNRLVAEKEETTWDIFLEEVREPMILLLLATGLLYSIWGELGDTLTIFFVILALVGVEVLNERRAKNAIAALSKLAEPTTPVRRDGHRIDIRAEDVVPGDLILLEAGRRIPADARLTQSFGVAADESAMTGESLPVDKDADAIWPEATPVAERSNMTFAGTTIVRGRGAAVVIATGMQTELGRTAALARGVAVLRTPLQRLMRELSKSLAWLAVAFSVLVPLLGWTLSGQPLRQMILTGLALAFSVIPEELPIIITMVLALGGYRLSKKHAIVKRLQAVETLGAVTVIATDKTGTLTENRMAVSTLYPEDSTQEILEIGVLCNDAAADGSGDPLDVALLQAAEANGRSVSGLRSRRLTNEWTFDTTRKRMSVVYEGDSGLWVGVKGAPEAVLTRCTSRRMGSGHRSLTDRDRQEIMSRADRMADQGMRVLAFAEKAAGPRAHSQDDVESDLEFVGLAGLADPPRPEARQAIASCRDAGIRPIMITGDHPLTAMAIAREIGLGGRDAAITGQELDAMSADAVNEAVRTTSVFARTTPQHKLRIVSALHERGEIVGVTGDGINDAPALAAADIGIAMGEMGTDVARQSADMVLADDNFATIVHAVEEGRVAFDNLRKALRYYLACKVALVLAMLLPVLLRLPVPFAPVQIILMELFMDLAASATFVAEPAEAGLMRRPPRDPNARLMDQSMVLSIFSSAVGLFAAVSVCYLFTWSRTHDLTEAQTMAFATWLLGHVFLALNLRSEREPLVHLGPFSNRIMVIWAAATVAVLLFATLVPGVRDLVKVAPLGGAEWALAVGAALAGTFWIEARKFLAGSR